MILQGQGFNEVKNKNLNSDAQQMDSQSPKNQQQVGENLQQTSEHPLLPLSDDDFVQLAKELFLTLDRAEEADVEEYS